MTPLPSHPSWKSLDPLGITDSEDPTVWEVLIACISNFRPSSTIWQLPHLIEDVVYFVHGKGNIDTQFLRHFLTACYTDPSSATSVDTLNSILDSALALPVLFPDHQISHLTELNPTLILSRKQIKCLVAHQLLGTLRPPRGNAWGCTFLCWYSDPQPLHAAVDGYLKTLFQFYSPSCVTGESVIYEFISLNLLGLQTNFGSWQSSEAPLFEHLVLEPTSTEGVEFPHDTLNSILVSSNKSPGFGNSCTQEELVTAACPELLPLGALLVSPPIPDEACLLVRNVTPITKWIGKGRKAHVVDYQYDRRQWTFLFLDALELDYGNHFHIPLPDVVPENLLREMQKAFIGFSALRRADVNDIASPIWGAGAFGGDAIIKAIILALGASQVGIKVWLSVDNAQELQAADNFAGESSDFRVLKILRDLQRSCFDVTARRMWALINAGEMRQFQNGKGIAEFIMKHAVQIDAY